MKTNKCCEVEKGIECCVEGQEELPENIKEMIAVGISAAINCRPCLDYHIPAALKAGVSEKEISDAVSLARMIVRNASSFTQQYAEKIIKKDTSESGGCCDD